jgi:hypothetical protein
MKRAFGALSSLVDAELDSCRGELGKLTTEVTRSAEHRSVQQQAVERIEQELAQQRVWVESKARATAEVTRQLAAQVRARAFGRAVWASRTLCDRRCPGG